MNKLIDIQIFQANGQVRVKNVYSNHEDADYTFLNGVRFTDDELRWLEQDLRAIYEKGLQLGQQRESARIRRKLGLDYE